MSKTEHSPLPWASMHDYVYRFDDGGIKKIAWMYSGSKTDADFIVTACNSYYDNQQAIAELVETLKVCVEHNEGCFENHYTFYREEAVTPEYIIKARALIAKHKAKP